MRVDRVLHRERVQVELAPQRVELLLGRLVQPDPDERARLVAHVVGVLELHLAVAPLALLVDRAVDDHRSGFLRSRRASSIACSRSLGLAGVRGLLELGEQAPELRARARCRARPRARRRAPAAAGGPLRRHSSAAAISSSASSRWASIARSAFLAAGGEPVRARQQRHLHLHRRGPLQVAVDAAAVERALVDEEAEHEVVAGHALEEAAEALARAQAAADVAHHLLAQPVVAHEGHAAVVAHVVRGGLADVVQERAEAQRLAARELVASGSSSSSRSSPRAPRPPARPGARSTSSVWP